MNICGCLVHVAPASLDSARDAIAAMDGVEVHAATNDGRLVVVVEDTADKRASDIIMAVHQVPGVLSLTLNYHHFEDLTQAQAASQPAPESQRTDA
ncbi:MAG: chaperone NapD [Paracoccus sp. (in: a-proteobacteria)]|uniref:chaperone NapD n=1 Tax=Paracoccus sp. TaxID=267 RepID=UPI0026E08699|nr:chaperone NapD [Paracoccus sp. (in: a-proteobacteria)]MDO5631082.1 chaperone NapD [Paracoccus sp. (in: a-proteobacteria)]